MIYLFIIFIIGVVITDVELTSKLEKERQDYKRYIETEYRGFLK